ncbi:hypothetical protein A2U01_0067878, partial [Trifolium medium]|nr:hypothetical protein [Trifolium medium]
VIALRKKKNTHLLKVAHGYSLRFGEIAPVIIPEDIARDGVDSS